MREIDNPPPGRQAGRDGAGWNAGAPVARAGGRQPGAFRIARRRRFARGRAPDRRRDWYFLSGRGEMWRRSAAQESVVAVEAGVALTIPLGTAFQFRATGEAPLTFLAITMPPWPGAEEAARVEGRWPATVATP